MAKVRPIKEIQAKSCVSTLVEDEHCDDETVDCNVVQSTGGGYHEVDCNVVRSTGRGDHERRHLREQSDQLFSLLASYDAFGGASDARRVPAKTKLVSSNEDPTACAECTEVYSPAATAKVQRPPTDRNRNDYLKLLASYDVFGGAAAWLDKDTVECDVLNAPLSTPTCKSEAIAAPTSFVRAASTAKRRHRPDPQVLHLFAAYDVFGAADLWKDRCRRLPQDDDLSDAGSDTYACNTVAENLDMDVFHSKGDLDFENRSCDSNHMSTTASEVDQSDSDVDEYDNAGCSDAGSCSSCECEEQYSDEEDL